MKKRRFCIHSLVCLRIPKRIWLDFSSWVMVEFMYAQVISVIMVVVSIANHVALTCDEVSMVDNGSCISIHAYLMQN